MKLFKKLFIKINKSSEAVSVQIKAQKLAATLQRSENATALDSGVFSVRLFYNALGQTFYTIGYHAEYFLLCLKRGMIEFAKSTVKLTHLTAKRLVVLSITLGKILLTDFKEPYNRIKQSFAHIKDDIADEYEKESYKIINKKQLRYALATLAAVYHLLIPILKFIPPVAAAAVFIFVVNVFSQYSYALNITLDGENLGIITSEGVYEQAQMLVRDRIKTVKDTEEWVVEPVFNLAVSNEKKTLNAMQLADTMVAASSDKIQNATGIIINGELLGVTTDEGALQGALNQLKAPFEDPNNPNLSVGFVKDVQLVNGVYFTSSITEPQPIVSTLLGEVSGEKLYTVVKGDSPSGIATKVGVPLKDLYALNPSLDPSINKRITMRVGDQILISNAVEFLQVKTVEKVTRQLSIAHSTNSTKSDKLAWGFQNVTQAGEDGIEERDVNVTRIGGIVVSEDILASRIIKEPITQEVTVGTKLASGGIAGDASTGVMMWPVPSYNSVSRDFRYDRGLDITASYGSAIVAADNGVVSFAGAGGGSFLSYGNYVTIQHSTGVVTLYAHMRNVAVPSGSYVKKGDVIGYVGLTGRTSGSHCHFETQVGGRPVDPYNYVKRG